MAPSDRNTISRYHTRDLSDIKGVLSTSSTSVPSEPYFAFRLCSLNVFCMCSPEDVISGQSNRCQANRPYSATREPEREMLRARSPSPWASHVRDSVSDIVASSGHPLIAVLHLRVGDLDGAQRSLRDIQSLAGGDWTLLDAIANVKDFEKEKRRILLQELLSKMVVQYADAVCSLSTFDLHLPILEHHATLPLSYGVKIADGLTQWVSVCDYDDADIAAGVAAYLEADLTGRFYEDLVKAEMLGESHDGSIVWHLVTRNKAQDVREDNVYRYQMVDVLEDPRRSVLIFVWTLPQGTTHIPGCKAIPGPLPGFVRSSFECTVYRFSPLWRSGSNTYLGFRLARSGISLPRASMYKVVKNMSVESLKASAKARNERFFQEFKRHLVSPALAKRMKGRWSTRTSLYDQLRHHLANVPRVN